MRERQAKMASKETLERMVPSGSLAFLGLTVWRAHEETQGL